MDAATRQLVRDRAQRRCEYCLLPESAFDLAFHVEHIVARQHAGLDDLENLALACDRCNLFKGTNLAGIDPETGLVIALFHPRRDQWADHFAMQGVQVIGRSPIGRATVRLLRMNAPARQQVREVLLRKPLT